MAKMFYTLEETAERLGVDEQEVKDMAAEGRLQQFRDRDKLMFKCEQVDALAAGDDTAAGGTGTAIPLTEDDTDFGTGTDTGEGTGVDVFETGEVDAADTAAQTQVTDPGDDTGEELQLESVGSGSGLLDLTRESDDTSLGAELLDEIYPSSAESASQSAIDSAVGSSGIFEESAASDAGGSAGQSAAASSIMADFDVTQAPPGETAGFMPGSYAAVEQYDPAGSSMSAGFLTGATLALIVGVFIAANAVADVNVPEWFTGSPGVYWAWIAGFAAIAVILGIVGYVVGRSSA